MLKLFLFIGVVATVLIAVIILVSWLAAMKRRQDESKLGIGARKARVKELESKTSKQESVLREIQDIATHSGIATGDPLWEVVAQKIEETLDERKDTGR